MASLSTNLDGELQWKRTDFPKMEMHLAFGEGIGPALHENTLLLTFDHKGDSFLLALDKRDGRELWRTERDRDQQLGAAVWSSRMTGVRRP